MLSQRKKLYYTILANAMIPLGGLSTDIYLPALPDIAHHFSVQRSLVQLTVTSFIIAMGILQLVVGPISDATGRKNPIIFAMITQFVAVIGILLSPTIYVMMAFRFIQGFGVAFMMVPARAIINDMYSGIELKKQMYYITISFAIGPILGPFIGGYLTHYIGWQANFLFTQIFIIAILLLVFFTYDETIAQTKKFSLNHLWHNYYTILQNKYFITCSIIAGVLWGYTMIFNVAGPFIVQTVMQESAIVFGKIALLMGVAWFSGNLLNRFALMFTVQFKSQLVLWLTSVTTLIMLLLSAVGYFDLPTLAIPVILITFFSSIAFSITVSEGLTLFPKLAASANAFLFSLAWIMSSFFTLFATQLKVHTLVPMALTFSVIAIANLAIYYGFHQYYHPE